MSTFLVVLIFLAVGVLVGFLGSRAFPNSNVWIDILLGLAGSFGISWVAKLLHLGTGFLVFSWWGLIFGILGACLFVGVYGFITRRTESHQHA